MTIKASRPLLTKRPLKPIRQSTSPTSYTEPKASKDELPILREIKDELRVREFSSQAVPQPFLDPSILEKRREAEKQQGIAEEKRNAKQT